MIEKHIDIAAKDGPIETFVCHPDGPGPWPAVIFFMDAPGIREELFAMARRLAGGGYYVLLPNLYYRLGRGVTLGPDCTDETSPEHQRMFKLMGTLSNALVAEDTGVLLDHIAKDPAARNDRVGVLGYCMSGQFALTAAARYPDRIAAAASFHGVKLATDAPDSPHRLADKIHCPLHIGFGETDPLTPPAEIEQVRKAFAGAGSRCVIEIYRDAGHGFVFPDRAAYHAAAAEKHWDRLSDLFVRTLK